MWKMIGKLKGIEKKERDTPLYDDDGAVVEEVMMNVWTSIYRNDKNEMTSEWSNGRGRENRDRWCQVSVSTSIKYGSVEICRKIPEHLTRNLDIGQGRMWRKRDGEEDGSYREDLCATHGGTYGYDWW